MTGIEAFNMPEVIRIEHRVVEEIHPFQRFLEIGNGWNMYYSSWNSAGLPLQPAVWALTQLYATIQVQAKGPWRKGPPQQVVRLVLGQIQLIMICPEKPISWDFVQRFATQMLTLTNQGWTGVYKFVLSQSELEMNIGVELNILPVK